MKRYTAPVLTDYGTVADITATLGDPFTGDVALDIDGNIVEQEMNSLAQCPAVEGYPCELANEFPWEP